MLVLAAATVAVSLSACGGDDDDGGAGSSTVATVGIDEDTTDSTGPVDTTAATDAVDTTEGADGSEQTEPTDAADGVEFESAEGDYTVTFPEEPTEQTQPQTLPDGQTMDLVLVGVELDDEFVATARGVYPSDYQLDPATALQGGQDQAIANVQGTLIDSRDITLQGRPGREFSASVERGGTPGTVLQQVFLDGQTIYQVIRTGAGELTFEDPESVALFGSFQFTSG
jgi:hypothetical protein